MNVSEIMHVDPLCCGPESNLVEVAEMMTKGDCGAIPVIEGKHRRPLGIVTDRDIVCRAIAEGRNPSQVKARDVMSTPVVPVRPEDSVGECRAAMERFKVRRLLVVDSDGALAGIVTQAQLSRVLPPQQTGDLLQSISKKSGKASHVTTAPEGAGR